MRRGGEGENRKWISLSSRHKRREEREREREREDETDEMEMEKAGKVVKAHHDIKSEIAN